MPNLTLRDDSFEFVGTVVYAGADAIPSPGVDVTRWTVEVRPAKGHEAAITSRTGARNPAGTVACTVALSEGFAPYWDVLPLIAGATGQRVRVLGTLCDDDDANGVTVIRPLAVLAIEHPLEVYDIAGWPTPVRDYDLLAFATVADGPLDLGEPHDGESRTLEMTLPAPFRPSSEAVLFRRAYPSTEIKRVASVSLDPEPDFDRVRLSVVTGAPADGLGFYSVQLGVSYDELDLADHCPPGSCEHDPGTFCRYEGRVRYTRVPAHLPYALAGDLAVSPGDGRGLVSGIVARLHPNQVFDHMGIFVDNGWTLRHCTSDQERHEDGDLWTAKITVSVLGAIDVKTKPIPLNGLRPDLLRFGWPGAITQTVEEIFRSGRNSRNPRWSFAGTHPDEDLTDPQDPGAAFRIYHLPRAERARRLGFNDPERDKAVSITRLQEESVAVGDPATVFTPLLVHPHAALSQAARPALRAVAEVARQLEAHYRFFAYTHGDIGIDARFVPPSADDPFWGNLPAAARWPAGTIPAVCSSFVWTAVHLANERADGFAPIQLEDRREPEDPARGLEYGARDGFYRYQVEERLVAAKGLVDQLKSKIRKVFDDEIPGVVYVMTPQLSAYREITATRVANQTANAFAFDHCESVASDWQDLEPGETVSPDNVRNFWDLKPVQGEVRHPDGQLAIYGDSTPITLTPPAWAWVRLYRRLNVDPGHGTVMAAAFINGQRTAGVTVRFDMGCQGATTSDHDEGAILEMEAGEHLADAFIALPNPVTGHLETFRTITPVEFAIDPGAVTRIELVLEPPSDLWRVIDVHLDADIHDKSFWGGDADAHHFIMDRPGDRSGFELRQDLGDDPNAPEEQQNTRLHHEETWRTEPEVGSGVHVAVALSADLTPDDRSVSCHCDVALIDTDAGGFLGIGTSVDVDQIESRDIVIAADQSEDVLVDVDFASDEEVPERARVSLRLTNRRRPA